MVVGVEVDFPLRGVVVDDVVEDQVLLSPRRGESCTARVDVCANAVPYCEVGGYGRARLGAERTVC